jgi:hypothetical protein
LVVHWCVTEVNLTRIINTFVFEEDYSPYLGTYGSIIHIGPSLSIPLSSHGLQQSLCPSRTTIVETRYDVRGIIKYHINRTSFGGVERSTDGILSNSKYRVVWTRLEGVSRFRACTDLHVASRPDDVPYSVCPIKSLKAYFYFRRV